MHPLSNGRSTLGLTACTGTLYAVGKVHYVHLTPRRHRVYAPFNLSSAAVEYPVHKPLTACVEKSTAAAAAGAAAPALFFLWPQLSLESREGMNDDCVPGTL